MNKTIVTGILALFALSSFASDASNEKVKDIYKGTELRFSKSIPLAEGQTGLMVAQRKCRINFGKSSSGLAHIEEGTRLEISRIRFERNKQVPNPATGEMINIHPTVKLNFKRTQTDLTCRGKDVENLTISDLEAEGILIVTPPTESTPFVFD